VFFKDKEEKIENEVKEMPTKKGIVGIEAAIVLIAFVIVAAALAFVVINMGMYTTQKSKEVMQQGLKRGINSTRSRWCCTRICWRGAISNISLHTIKGITRATSSRLHSRNRQYD